MSFSPISPEVTQGISVNEYVPLLELTGATETTVLFLSTNTTYKGDKPAPVPGAYADIPEPFRLGSLYTVPVRFITCRSNEKSSNTKSFPIFEFVVFVLGSELYVLKYIVETVVLVGSVKLYSQSCHGKVVLVASVENGKVYI